MPATCDRRTPRVTINSVMDSIRAAIMMKIKTKRLARKVGHISLNIYLYSVIGIGGCGFKNVDLYHNIQVRFKLIAHPAFPGRLPIHNLTMVMVSPATATRTRIGSTR